MPHQIGTPAVVMGRRGIRNAAQNLLAVGHGGRADCQDALAGLKVRQRLDGLLAGVTEIMPDCAVKMQIQQSGQGVQALRIDDFLVQLRSCAKHNALVPDDKILPDKRLLRRVYQCIFDNHGKILPLCGIRSGSAPRRHPPG